MSKSTMSEIFDKIERAPTVQDKIRLLQENRHQPIIDILQGVFDTRIKWLLPEGPVPYKPSKRENIESALFSETKKLYLFAEGGNPNLAQARREVLFIQLLENIDPRDAKMLESVKDKKFPWPSITVDIVRAAFPDVYIETTAIELPEEKIIPVEDVIVKKTKPRKVKAKKEDVKNETIQ